MEERNGKIVYSVSEINKNASDYIASEPMFRNVVVKGEISNCTYQQSKGHYYFSIKDRGSILQCVFFNTYARRLDYRLQNGMLVYVTGGLEIYPEYGKYQLKAVNVERADQDRGEIYQAYLRLKEQLAEEGIFDFEHKLPIPKYPDSVGIITSQDGAVVHDIIEEASRRNPYVQFYLYPAQVQGRGSAESVARGIDFFENMGVDTIILGRGGGSTEELGAFDTELVARRIYSCTVPIISATGHAVHNTLADYAADDRAITPTQAGEKVVADIMTTIRQVHKSRDDMDRNMNYKLSNYQMRVNNLKLSIEKKNPEKLLGDQKHKVETYMMNYRSFLEQKLQSRQKAFTRDYDRMNVLMDNKFRNTENRFNIALAKLDALSPTAKLRGGYGYIESGGEPVTSAGGVTSGDKILITLHDGNISATVD